MSEDNTFTNLIRRVRAGEEDAATELVRRYEPGIRRAVRIRLHDARLGRVLESMDVCQSVLASFFVRAALGQYQLERPEDLLKLLATMARNKGADQARRQRADCRDNRRVVACDADEAGVAGPDATPSRQVAAKELLHEARSRLAPEELQLLECRQEGLEWAEIAARLGGTPEGRRKQWARAVERVTQELGLEE